MTRPLFVLASALMFAACAPQYVYQPAADATATIQGHKAADYQIPPTAPQGDVRLASFGMAPVSLRSAPDVKQRALHVRMIVADNGLTPWTLDARQQFVALQDGRKLAPSYVTTREGQAGLPTVTIPAGGKQVIDMFYTLPPDKQSATQVPEFDVLWRIDTPQQQVAERTPFDRLRVEPEVAYGYGPDDWGAWDAGWDGPFWGGDVLVGSPGWGGW
jgi:hypothetical protein